MTTVLFPQTIRTILLNYFFVNFVKMPSDAITCDMRHLTHKFNIILLFGVKKAERHINDDEKNHS